MPVSALWRGGEHGGDGDVACDFETQKLLRATAQAMAVVRSGLIPGSILKRCSLVG